MRILFDARRSVARATGIGRMINGLLRTLVRDGRRHEYLVITGEHDPLAGLRADNVEVRNVGLPLNSLRINTTLPALARTWRADVAYFPYWYAPLWMPCPFVVAIHDVIQIRHPEGISLSHRALFRTYGGLVAGRARRVHALASHGKDALSRVFGIKPEAVDVVPPALDLEFDVVAAGGRPSATDQRPFALYVGNHKPHKNLQRLLRAYASVADRMESRLVVVGAMSSQADPNELPHMKLVADLSLSQRVEFVGQVDDAALKGLYRSARFFVFPSLYEGFGLPVLEAMACGTPVICSNTSSLPEVAANAALTFDPQDEDAIAAALLRIDRSPELRAELSEKGRIQSKTFSWTRSADAWLVSMSAAAGR
jgi:alpha-1,3-rhamnosyl/mannosyltransferase